MATQMGTPGDDVIVGTYGADSYDISQGGADTVTGRQGNDTIVAGAAFDALDRLDGGVGYDWLFLAGDYAVTIVLAGRTLRNMEEIHFGAGFSYRLVLAKHTVADGGTLKLDGRDLAAGETLYVDSEPSSTLLFLGGAGNDTVIGASGTFSLVEGGEDVVLASYQDDVFDMGATFDSGDRIDGGGGNDVLALEGDYGAGLAIDAAFMANIRTLRLSGDFSYVLSVSDNVVGNGQVLFVDGKGIGGGGSLAFDGSAESNGTFSFRASTGNDILQGGARNDTFDGAGGGSDVFHGNGGDDTFLLYGTLDATDEILGGDGNDTVRLSGDYSAGLVLGPSTLRGIETLSVNGNADCSITTDDATVGAGARLVVSSGLSADYRMVFDGSAETDGSFRFQGGGGDDIFKGGAGDDYLDAGKNGDDSFNGGGGDDTVDFLHSFSTDDIVDGGEGYDRVLLTGYLASAPAALIRLGSGEMRNVEAVSLATGYSYAFKTQDSLVASGATMAFDASGIAAGKSFSFDGSAETDGHFRLTGGDGDDTLKGGRQADEFVLNRGGDDTWEGGRGDDVFWLLSGFDAADAIDGGSGIDTVELSAATGLGVSFGPATMTNVEKLNLHAGHGYELATAEATVARGELLTVDARYLGAGDAVVFDGSAETDGRFTVFSGAGADHVDGGAKGDLIEGAGGGDELHGNGGADTLVGGLGTDELYGGLDKDRFVFASAAETTVAGADTIHDWNAGDKIDLSAIDADAGLAGDQAFAWIGSRPFSAAGQLQAIASDGMTLVQGDVDGDGTADFQIRLAGAPALVRGSFVL